jgi:hypothetical protein
MGTPSAVPDSTVETDQLVPALSNKQPSPMYSGQDDLAKTSQGFGSNLLEHLTPCRNKLGQS